MLARLLSVTLLAFVVTMAASPVKAQDQPLSLAEPDSARHAALDRLLARFVNDEGRVDYAGLKQHTDSVLVPYLKQLAATDPANLPSREARLAFWINAYNAYALQQVADHYPVENIWGTTPGPSKPSKDESPFKQKIAEVADTTRSLDEIEHQIIRVRFDEPRIHYAVNCAAASCPPLRQEAYAGPRLNAQLDDQARAFLHDDTKNRVPAGEDRIVLSRILKWFQEDFGPSTDALQRATAPYFEAPVRERLKQADYEVDFLPYDWSLNDQDSQRSQ